MVDRVWEGWVVVSGAPVTPGQTAQALKPSGAPRLETTKPLLARGGFVLN